jgi:hypothetical protein
MNALMSRIPETRYVFGHGIRFGAIRQTSVGKLEERLPFMFLIFPDWFIKKYPNIHRNLQVNSRRLTRIPETRYVFGCT